MYHKVVFFKYTTVQTSYLSTKKTNGSPNHISECLVGTRHCRLNIPELAFASIIQGMCRQHCSYEATHTTPALFNEPSVSLSLCLALKQCCALWPG
jgi:hypothetical protein